MEIVSRQPRMFWWRRNKVLQVEMWLKDDVVVVVVVRVAFTWVD